jgi:hypothetical protein
MDVGTGHGAAGREHEFDRQQLTVGIRGRLAEDDLLAAYRVLQNLSCMSHRGPPPDLSLVDEERLPGFADTSARGWVGRRAAGFARRAAGFACRAGRPRVRAKGCRLARR